MDTSIKTNKLVRTILFPFLIIRRKRYRQRRISLGKNNPKALASMLYRRVMKKELDWENPGDLNAKN